MRAIADLFFIVGSFFVLAGVIGIIRLPDLYTRIHPAGKAGTAGIFSICVGLMLYSGVSLTSLRILIIAIFMLITNPVAAHAITRGAFEAKIKPWKKKHK